VGDVADGVGHRHDAQLDPELRAVLAVVEHFHDHRLPALQRRAQCVERRAVGVRPLQQTRGAPQDLGGRIAGRARESLVDVDDARPRLVERPGLGDQDRVVGVDHNRLQQAQALLGLLPYGDVDEADHDLDSHPCSSCPRRHGCGVGAYPTLGAVGARDAQREIATGPAGARRGQQGMLLRRQGRLRRGQREGGGDGRPVQVVQCDAEDLLGGHVGRDDHAACVEDDDAAGQGRVDLTEPGRGR